MVLIGMRRVVVLGRGGAGKSVMAAKLGRITGLPVFELDAFYWSSRLEPTAPKHWREIQSRLAAADEWIVDGDLGPHDVLEPRLARADTIVILDFWLVGCAWRTLRRGLERSDFWFWMVNWLRRGRCTIIDAIARYAPTADVHVLESPAKLRAWLATVGASGE
jgi:adenylate kinase family enzyme